MNKAQMPHLSDSILHFVHERFLADTLQLWMFYRVCLSVSHWSSVHEVYVIYNDSVIASHH